MEGQVSHSKTRLHNRVIGHGWSRPEYQYEGPTVREGGTNQWLCIVRMNASEWGRAYGPSRHAASEAAAAIAYSVLIQQGY
ncbi:uncharacterized protein SCHCODRAFT_02688658 [Schizophyllum commune H4-8]|uniref:uncharacterized protein n=1 Tax=Schizophyllum commune (strain H4-8 / FGSC 9210) TaxID=578458 RepID=UPI0021608422|nr:uncharacterized protein SCHCODRAFT_02688658 [Schizophyllum commune H4-8]KAI5892259.1 hypothetical protein SCHCODRAFT_02688658 [Schizophyllum commune H4-8]